MNSTVRYTIEIQLKHRYPFIHIGSTSWAKHVFFFFFISDFLYISLYGSKAEELFPSQPSCNPIQRKGGNRRLLAMVHGQVFRNLSGKKWGAEIWKNLGLAKSIISKSWRWALINTKWGKLPEDIRTVFTSVALKVALHHFEIFWIWKLENSPEWIGNQLVHCIFEYHVCLLVINGHELKLSAFLFRMLKVDLLYLIERWNWNWKKIETRGTINIIQE